VFYCSIVDHRIVMLHWFLKKSQQTPRNELEVARKRLLEIKREYV
jgi:phage-related protein